MSLVGIHLTVLEHNELSGFWQFVVLSDSCGMCMCKARRFDGVAELLESSEVTIFGVLRLVVREVEEEHLVLLNCIFNLIKSVELLASWVDVTEDPLFQSICSPPTIEVHQFALCDEL